uniref:Uncharacterized protein n=1 Tax=Cacopsylla melanoneura TaxID=428564 RepID=A0A8D8XCX9_9HEMI
MSFSTYITVNVTMKIVIYHSTNDLIFSNDKFSFWHNLIPIPTHLRTSMTVFAQIQNILTFFDDLIIKNQSPKTNTKVTKRLLNLTNDELVHSRYTFLCLYISLE